MRAPTRPRPSRPLRSLLVPLLVVLSAPPALSACGGGGGGGPGQCSRALPSDQGPGDAGRHFPLAVGDRWLHEVTTVTGTTTLEAKVTGEQAVDGALARVVTLSALDGAGAPEEQLLRNGPSGVSVHASAAEPFPTPGVLPFVELRWPLTPGDAFVAVSCTGRSLGEDLDGDGRPERFDLRVEVAVGGDEAVTVPAGAFTAREVTTTITMTVRATGGQSATLAVHEQDWYAPGVGPVRTAVDEVVVPGGAPPEHTESVLVGYEVGGVRGGLQRRAAVAPDLVTGDEPPAAARLGDRHLLLGVVSGSPWPRLSGRILDAGGAVAGSLELGSWYATGLPAGLAASGAAWLAVTQPCPSSCELRAVRIAPDGALLDPLPGVLVGSGNVVPPAVASDGSGWLLAWYRYPTGMGGARVDASGALLGEHTFLDLPVGFPAVAYAGGVYLVAFGDQRDSGTAISAIRVAPDGTVLDVPPIAVSAPPGTKTLGGVATDGEGFLVVWGDSRRGDMTPGFSAEDVYAARVTAGGELLDGPVSGGGIAVNALPGQHKLDPRVASDGERYVVTWWIDGYWPPAGAYAARVTSDGALLDGLPGGAGLPVALPGQAHLRARYPLATPAGGGETLILWARDGAGIEGGWYAW